jgi:hypothetical protein
MATLTERQAFLDQIMPLANKYGSSSGIDPNLIVAQAALESSWGKSAPNNNYFGIKGPGGLQTTQEFVGGKMVTVQDSFRGYSSLEDSVQGYTGFLASNPRYTDVFGKSGDAAADAVANAGYATDPNYSNKLKSIIKSISTSDVINGAKAAVQVATGNPVGAIKTIIGNPFSSDSDNDEEGGGLFGWLRRLFSANTAARFAAIVIGLLLIAGAIWALLNSDTIINNIGKGIENVA